MSSTLAEEWRSEGPGHLPWWRVGRPRDGDDGPEIEVDETRPRIQMNGRSNVEMRPRMEIARFIELGAEACGVMTADLRSTKRRSPVVEAREILAWLGTTHYGFKVKEIASGFEKYGETASRLVSRAARRRMDDVGFADRIKSVDSAITKGATRVGRK
jgi:chromosomal replication initiation ATPase DnaA